MPEARSVKGPACRHGLQDLSGQDRHPEWRYAGRYRTERLQDNHEQRQAVGIGNRYRSTIRHQAGRCRDRPTPRISQVGFRTDQSSRDVARGICPERRTGCPQHRAADPDRVHCSDHAEQQEQEAGLGTDARCFGIQDADLRDRGVLRICYDNCMATSACAWWLRRGSSGQARLQIRNPDVSSPRSIDVLPPAE